MSSLREECPGGGVRRYPRKSLATWPSGLGNGLQSRVREFDSRRRLKLVERSDRGRKPWSESLRLLGARAPHRQLLTTERATFEF